MVHRILVLPEKQNMEVPAGANLLDALRQAGIFVNAPCGGNGSCGKCKVLLDGQEVLACRTVVDRDMTVQLPASPVAADSSEAVADHGDSLLLALDIGTTTVAAYLLDEKTGRELAKESALNPQAAFGADVISRIRHALDGHMDQLTQAIRDCVQTLACTLCKRAGADPGQIRLISLVGNPAMQQLYLGISPENLVQLPFAPVLTQAKTVAARDYLPLCPRAQLQILPDISGYVGADTVAGILATGMAQTDEITLLVDIGTNGEMVLGNRHRMVACSTAAGPALEGANIYWGMRAAEGAIDHVWKEHDRFGYSVIGGGDAAGICGSGLVDAVAAALDADLINSRGRIQNQERTISLTHRVCLTQEDIRQVQLAKGAIAAGISLMAAHLGISLEQIHRVCLAGAFGSYLNPQSVLRIGLLPLELQEKLTFCGNTAGSGAKLLAQDPDALSRAQQLADSVEFLELASVPDFQRCFAQCMYFTDAEAYWCQAAKVMGFTEAAPLDIATLRPREDVRAMCAQDKCGAYGKNWTCPPHCGTLAQCAEKMGSYRHGILLQTVGAMAKAIDTKAYRRTEQLHLEQFHALVKCMAIPFPNALFLGSGGCRLCRECAYPDPCRFPEEACSSMEGYGLFVTDVCRENGLAYHHGDKTVTYTACILF